MLTATYLALSPGLKMHQSYSCLHLRLTLSVPLFLTRHSTQARTYLAMLAPACDCCCYSLVLASVDNKPYQLLATGFTSSTLWSDVYASL